MSAETIVVFLNGSKEDKEKFNNVIKYKLKYQTWNDSPIKSIVRYLGWDLEDQGIFEYGEFGTKLSHLANNFFDFPAAYICKKIETATKSDKCQVLIFHDVATEIVEKVGGDCQNIVFEIYLTDKRKPTEDGVKFELNVNDSTFQEDVARLLNILSK